MFACTQIQKQLDAFPLFRSSVTLNRIVLFIFALLLCARFSLPLTPASLPFPSLYLPSLPLLIRLPSSPPHPLPTRAKGHYRWPGQCRKDYHPVPIVRTVWHCTARCCCYSYSCSCSCCPCVVPVLSLCCLCCFRSYASLSLLPQLSSLLVLCGHPLSSMLVLVC